MYQIIKTVYTDSGLYMPCPYFKVSPTEDPVSLWKIKFFIIINYLNSRPLLWSQNLLNGPFRRGVSGIRIRTLMGHPDYHAQITRSWICVFSDHLPDSLLLPLEQCSYLKVICAQSWEDIEAFLDLRSPKISPHWLHP